MSKTNSYWKKWKGEKNREFCNIEPILTHRMQLYSTVGTIVSLDSVVTAAVEADESHNGWPGGFIFL